MTTDDELEPLKQALESMTDDEVDTWLAGRDFESVRGVKLPAEAAQRVMALVAGAEVEGFTLNFNVLGGLEPPALGGPDTVEDKINKGGAIFRHCCQGTHYKQVKL